MIALILTKRHKDWIDEGTSLLYTLREREGVQKGVSRETPVIPVIPGSEERGQLPWHGTSRCLTHSKVLISRRRDVPFGCFMENCI